MFSFDAILPAPGVTPGVLVLPFQPAASSILPLFVVVIPLPELTVTSRAANKLTLPSAEIGADDVLILSALAMLTAPPPVWLIPVIFSGTVLDSLIAPPPELVALKALIAFAPINDVPPVAEVINEFAVINPLAVSLIKPAAANVTIPAPVPVALIPFITPEVGILTGDPTVST